MNEIIKILWIHFFADFVLQHPILSQNKNKSVEILAIHCIIYGIPFLYFGWKFALIAGVLHFPIDYVTSKITHRLYNLQKYYLFFVVIGLDQAIHMTILFTTYERLLL